MRQRVAANDRKEGELFQNWDFNPSKIFCSSVDSLERYPGYLSVYSTKPKIFKLYQIIRYCSKVSAELVIKEMLL